MRSCGTEREEGRIEEGERGVMERGGREGRDGERREDREKGGGGRVGTDAGERWVEGREGWIDGRDALRRGRDRVEGERAC